MYYGDGILCLRRDNYKEMPGEIIFLLIIFKECGSIYPYVKSFIFKVMTEKLRKSQPSGYIFLKSVVSNLQSTKGLNGHRNLWLLICKELYGFTDT